METLKFNGLEIDPDRHEVNVAGRLVELTNKEFKILYFLSQNEGRVFDRDRLLQAVWREGSNVKSRTVDVHIRRIREKLGEAGRNLFTLRGVGYKFKNETPKNP